MAYEGHGWDWVVSYGCGSGLGCDSLWIAILGHVRLTYGLGDRVGRLKGPGIDDLRVVFIKLGYISGPPPALS